MNQFSRLNFPLILLIIGSFLLVISACSQNGAKKNTTTTQPKTTTQTEEVDERFEILSKALPEHPQHPGIPHAERGITLVTTTGWADQQMEFHQGYCEQMMASMENEIVGSKFCECFLAKIQYYYEPIYFKDAYEDQGLWNRYCYAYAMKAKEEE
ncbi:hypothetical protein N8482_00260 [Chitinophagales bacterium]|nr:hypothetical protein [Chitinophagales bacterium]